jgi:hypothetical protein
MALTYKEANNFIASILSLRDGADDALASTAVGAYPSLNADGTLIKAGTRINWNGVVKKAAVDLWDTEENNPDNAPAVWADLNYHLGHRIIPETIDVATAFGMDELGWWGDTLYRSKLTANVYTPKQYPAGCEEV